MKKIYAALLISAMAFSLYACSNAETKQTELVVYTSIYPLQYIVDFLGGDHVQSISIYPPGTDAHTYEPTTRQMTHIAEGDAFIYLGPGMEGFMEAVDNALDEQPVKRISLMDHEELFDSGHLDGAHAHNEHDHGDKDPHIWLDPVRMSMMADIVHDVLQDLNPKNERTFSRNLQTLKAELASLDDAYRETLTDKSHKNILVSHAAYGYWEERYDIKQVAITGLSSTNEPSQRDLIKIIEQARQENMEHIIFEQNNPSRIPEIIRNQIGADVLTIHNLSVLTEEDIRNGEDYFSLMEHNLHILDKATGN